MVSHGRSLRAFNGADVAAEPMNVVGRGYSSASRVAIPALLCSRHLTSRALF